MNKKIYIIGDSHCNSFGYHSKFEKIWMNKKINEMYLSRTAFNLHKYKLQFEQLLEQVTSNDILLCIFGELDCRLHIYNKYRTTNTPLILLIQRTVISYINFLVQYQNKYNQLCVVHIVPPGTEPQYVWNFKYYGTREERRMITEIFNYMLMKECMNNHLPFLDVYDDLVDDNGWLYKHISRDDVHLNIEHPNLIYNKYFINN